MDHRELGDKESTKRRVRNLSEKKRRDQFNVLINELSSMLSHNNRKLDKSTILKSTISFLQRQHEFQQRSEKQQVEENWKPQFLSNDEFIHLMLEALDSFIIVLSTLGKILYVSETVTSILGYLPADVVNLPIYHFIHENDREKICNLLSDSASLMPKSCKAEDLIFNTYLKHGTFHFEEKIFYEPVVFITSFHQCKSAEEFQEVFVAIVSLQTRPLMRELSLAESLKYEFSSRQSLEWKFLLLDHRAPSVIGYLPFEVLGTSFYDYIHIDDLPKLIACHEALMQTGEGMSCCYRLLTKGHQWIWLQTRYYISYHQWNSKPEFITCVHFVMNISEVAAQLRKEQNQIHLTVVDNSNSSTSLTCEQQSLSTHSSMYHSSNSTVSPNCLSPSSPSRKSSVYSIDSSTFGSRFKRLNCEVNAVDDETHCHHKSTVNNSENDRTKQYLDLVPNIHPSISIIQEVSLTQLNPKHSISAASTRSSFSQTNHVTTTFHPSWKLPSANLASPYHQQQPPTTTVEERLLQKQEFLQKEIRQQQEELQKVHEQLVLTQLVPRTSKIENPSTRNSEIVSLPSSSSHRNDSEQVNVKYL